MIINNPHFQNNYAKIKASREIETFDKFIISLGFIKYDLFICDSIIHLSQHGSYCPSGRHRYDIHTNIEGSTFLFCSIFGNSVGNDYQTEYRPYDIEYYGLEDSVKKIAVYFDSINIHYNMINKLIEYHTIDNIFQIEDCPTFPKRVKYGFIDYDNKLYCSGYGLK